MEDKIINCHLFSYILPRKQIYEPPKYYKYIKRTVKKRDAKVILEI